MNYTIEELKIGQTSSFSKTITETDVYLFAGITGDFNPAHINAQYAANTQFKERIAHGMLSASLISTILGTVSYTHLDVYKRQALRCVWR